MTGYLRKIFLLLICILLCSAMADAADKKGTAKKLTAPVVTSPAPPSPLVNVQEIKYWSNPDYTRIAIALDRDATWKSHELDKGAEGKPGRIFIDINNARLDPAIKDISIGDGLLKKVRVAQFKPGVVRVVLDTDNIKDYKIFPLSDPARLIIDVRGEHREEIQRLESVLSQQVQELPSEVKPAHKTDNTPCLLKNRQKQRADSR